MQLKARNHTDEAFSQVNNPVATSICYGEQPCTVTWLDDGQAPLLSDIGACYVGLYNGNGVRALPFCPITMHRLPPLLRLLAYSYPFFCCDP